LFIDVTAAISRDAFGADIEYERYEFGLNHYHPLGASGVLASRIASQYVGSSAPFFLYPAFGQGADLRGYQMGSYRDQFLVAAQAEYRHRFTERIGAVAFAGVGSVSPDFFGWEKTLGSFGAGFRWVVAPKNGVSLRVDVARGRDETIYYVGVGEAF
jgi:outer membrane translocation and assembly module TamA